MLFKVCCQTGQLGNRGHIKFPAQSIAFALAQNHFTNPIALVIYWFFGDPKLSYTCAFWELFLNIDTNQRYMSKYDNMLVVFYGMGNVACNFCFKPVLVYTFT